MVLLVHIWPDHLFTMTTPIHCACSSYACFPMVLRSTSIAAVVTVTDVEAMIPCQLIGQLVLLIISVLLDRGTYSMKFSFQDRVYWHTYLLFSKEKLLEAATANPVLAIGYWLEALHYGTTYFHAMIHFLTSFFKACESNFSQNAPKGEFCFISQDRKTGHAIC